MGAQSSYALLAGKWGELPFGTSSERSLQDLTSAEQTAVLVSLRTLSDADLRRDAASIPRPH